MVDREYSKSDWFTTGNYFGKSNNSIRVQYLLAFLLVGCEFGIINLFLYNLASAVYYYLFNCLFAVVCVPVFYICTVNVYRKQFVKVYSKYKLVKCTRLSVNSFEVQSEGVSIELDVPQHVKSVIIDCFLMQSELENNNFDFEKVMSTFKYLFNALDYVELLKLGNTNVDIYLDLFYTTGENKLLSVDIYFKMGDNPPIKVVQ